ncbi:hypothetical protein HDC37_000050 [Microbacterium sp. AK009]|uniref:hypothetical protein n=1 Tax=Microbacterium sp. AK009 TaxID=2723068 RepID=UPI0017BB7654|nr:hypothetical protein [Microbacterium sp. AK009]NYF15238.1 hypothetical protein [Microbacterium sp. AK009]
MFLRSCAVAVAVVGLALVGCAAADTRDPPASPAPAAAALPAGVRVEIIQLRADVALRQAQVHVVNGGDTDLQIGEVAVDDSRFTAPATRVLAGRTSTVPAGGEVDIRVQLPDVACSPPAAGSAEPTVELTFLADGAEGTARVVAADPLGFLAPLHERECRASALAEAATLAFTGFTPAPPGQPATLHLTITPTGRGEATVVAVQATNLLDFGPATVDGAFPLDVPVTPGDTEPVVVDVPILPSRCDPHAVQEDKRGTIFDVRLSLGGEPGEIELFVGEALRGDILTWVSGWCGFAGAG